MLPKYLPIAINPNATVIIRCNNLLLQCSCVAISYFHCYNISLQPTIFRCDNISFHNIIFLAVEPIAIQHFVWQLWLWPQNEFVARDHIAMEQTAWQLVVFIVTLDKVLLELKKVLQQITIVTLDKYSSR